MYSILVVCVVQISLYIYECLTNKLLDTALWPTNLKNRLRTNQDVCICFRSFAVLLLCKSPLTKYMDY